MKLFHRTAILRVCCLAAAGLLLFSLCGCTPPDTPPESETTAAPAETQPTDVQATDVQATGTEPTETEPAETAAPQPDVVPETDPLAFDSETDWRAFLTGTWDYTPAGEAAPALTVTLAEDGGFTVQKGDALFSGKWELGYLFNEAPDLPDWLTFSLSEQYGNIPSFGDFTVGLRSVVNAGFTDACVAALWAQVNNGDSFFSYYYNDFSPVLVKRGTAPLTAGKTRCGERFYAVCWKVSTDVSAFDAPNDTAIAALWLDDAVDATGRTADFWCSVPYPVAPDAELRCSLSALRPGSVVEVETDETGAVVMLNWAADGQ